MRARNLAGILWMLLTGFLFVAVTVIVRHLGSDLPAVQGAFLRYLFGTLLIFPVLLRLGSGLIRRAPMRLYVARGVCHGAGVMLWFYAMGRIPVADVIAVGYAVPVFVILGAAFFLGERLHPSRVLAVVAGFLGVLVIVRPGFETIELGMTAQLVATPFFAASFLIAKKITETETPIEVVAMLSICCTLVLLPGALWQWRAPTGSELFWLFLTAFFATTGHYALTRALEAAPLTVTQPVTFVQLIWATLVGSLIFAEPADVFVFIGGGIIVAAACFTSHQDVKRSRPKA